SSIPPTRRNTFQRCAACCRCTKPSFDRKRTGPSAERSSPRLNRRSLLQRGSTRSPKPGCDMSWGCAQDRLAALSRQGVHVVAEKNGHSLALENPKLVAAAIEAVVRATRGEPFDVSEVRSLAARLPQGATRSGPW